MDERTFWDMIEAAFGSGDSSPDNGLEALAESLGALPRTEVVAFQEQMNAALDRAYTWDLIAAACFVGSGHSDDGLQDFRAWLISRGRETFDRVVADPNALADLAFDESPIEEWALEALHMLPGEVGGEEDDPDWPYASDPDSPSGTRVDLRKDVLRARFPVLWARFADRFMIITA